MCLGPLQMVTSGQTPRPPKVRRPDTLVAITAIGALLIAVGLLEAGKIRAGPEEVANARGVLRNAGFTPTEVRSLLFGSVFCNKQSAVRWETAQEAGLVCLGPKPRIIVTHQR